MSKKPIEQVLKDHNQDLIAVQGFQGYYQGQNDKGEDCIVVMIDSLTEENKKQIPDSLDGYPVRIEAGGKIKPL